MGDIVDVEKFWRMILNLEKPFDSVHYMFITWEVVSGGFVFVSNEMVCSHI